MSAISIKLRRLLLRDFGEEDRSAFLTYQRVSKAPRRVTGSKLPTVCSADSGLLSCNLAPNTSVRISWAGYEGGFRISPKGARLTFDGNGLQCYGD